MTRRGKISRSGDKLGSAGPRVTRTSNTTPQNSVSDKAGLCRAHLGYNNNRGVHIKLGCRGGLHSHPPT